MFSTLVFGFSATEFIASHFERQEKKSRLLKIILHGHGLGAILPV